MIDHDLGVRVVPTQRHDDFGDKPKQDPQTEHDQEDDRHQDHNEEHIRNGLTNRNRRIINSVRRHHATYDDPDNRLQNVASHSRADPLHETPPAHERQGGAEVCQQDVIHPVRVDVVERVQRVIGSDQGNRDAKRTQQVDKERNRHLNLHIMPYY